jgi:hypothetical protein
LGYDDGVVSEDNMSGSHLNSRAAMHISFGDSYYKEITDDDNELYVLTLH